MVDNSNPHIIAFTIGSYPSGNAYSNRVHSLFKGLTDLECDVTLVLLAPGKEINEQSNPKCFSLDGISIRKASLLGYTNIKFFRVLNFLIGITRALIWLLFKVIKQKQKPKLFLLFANPFALFPFVFISKLLKLDIFHERTEYPAIGKKGILGSLELKIYLNHLIPRFDGIIVISMALRKFFYSYIDDHSKILLLPMTVQFGRFEKIEKITLKRYGNYIAYCGSMYTDKDGIPDLIDAFNIFCQTNKDLSLLLIGDNSDEAKFNKIQEQINASVYKDRIFCSGWISRNLIPSYLMKAEVLVLARPDNIQSAGGFPTKLGEYLATGKPAVITNVGEISEYLEDGISAYISPPNNPSVFAQKLSSQ